MLIKRSENINAHCLVSKLCCRYSFYGSGLATPPGKQRVTIGKKNCVFESGRQNVVCIMYSIVSLLRQFYNALVAIIILPSLFPPPISTLRCVNIQWKSLWALSVSFDLILTIIIIIFSNALTSTYDRYFTCVCVCTYLFMFVKYTYFNIFTVHVIPVALVVCTVFNDYRQLLIV